MKSEGWMNPTRHGNSGHYYKDGQAICGAPHVPFFLLHPVKGGFPLKPCSKCCKILEEKDERGS